DPAFAVAELATVLVSSERHSICATIFVNGQNAGVVIATSVCAPVVTCVVVHGAGTVAVAVVVFAAINPIPMTGKSWRPEKLAIEAAPVAVNVSSPRSLSGTFRPAMVVAMQLTFCVPAASVTVT